MAFLGFLGIFVYYNLIFTALNYSTAQEVTIVNYTWPIWTVLFSKLIFKEKLTLIKLIGLFAGAIGVYISVTKGNFLSIQNTNLLGITLVLFAAIIYGLFSILSKKFNYDRFILAFIGTVFSFILVLITIGIQGNIPLITIKEFWGLLWLGIGSTGLAHVFWNLALKYGDTAKISNIMFITPFLSLVYIYVLLKEPIHITSIIGLLFVVLGIIMQSPHLSTSGGAVFRSFWSLS